MRSMFYLFKQKPEWIVNCFSELNLICKKRRLLIIILLISAALILFIYNNYQLSSKINFSQTNQFQVINKKLNELSSAMYQIENRYNHPGNNQKSLEKEINAISQTLTNLSKESDINKLIDQVNVIQVNMDKQVDEIKKSLSSGFNDKKYLDQSSLPFSVLTIDVISGQSYVSVNYNNHITPLSVNDVLADWRLTTANFDENTAEFVNSKDQYIQVKLSEMSS